MYRLFQERQVYQEFQLYPVNLNGLERQVYQEYQVCLVFQLIQGYH